MNLDRLRQDRSVYWVASENNSEKKRGTFEEPFTDISIALQYLKPGGTLAVKEGRYSGNVTFQISGEREKPVRIIAAPGAGVKILESCWYLYDCSDLIVEGFSFIKSPVSSLLIMGKSERNLFKNLNFLECSNGQDKGCTVFFGGSGIKDNIVEECIFDNNPGKKGKNPVYKNIACMISDDRDEDITQDNTEKTFFRNNTFRHYWRALQIGSYENNKKRSSHVIEGNYILDCAESGICINSSDSVVKNNLFQRCTGKAAVVISGSRNLFTDNRIEVSNSAIMISNPDQTIKNNCIIDYKNCGVYITAQDDSEKNLTTLFIQNNNFIRTCSKTGRNSSSIYSDSVSPCLIESNIFSDSADPCYFSQKEEKKRSRRFIENNMVCKKSSEMPGCRYEQITFEDMENGNYEQPSQNGAHGWMALSTKISRTVGGAQDLPEIADSSSMKASEEIIDRVNREDILKTAGFLDNEEE